MATYYKELKLSSNIFKCIVIVEIIYKMIHFFLEFFFLDFLSLVCLSASAFRDLISLIKSKKTYKRIKNHK